jgi:IMP dehydrogenase
MIGSWLAGTYESAADALRDSDGRLYKENYGMASKRAVQQRSAGESTFSRALKERFEEGISESRMYLDLEAPSVEDIVDRIVSGVRSAFTYAGARTIDDFHERAVIGLQSSSGYTEGTPITQSW